MCSHFIFLLTDLNKKRKRKILNIKNTLIKFIQRREFIYDIEYFVLSKQSVLGKVTIYVIKYENRSLHRFTLENALRPYTKLSKRGDSTIFSLYLLKRWLEDFDFTPGVNFTEHYEYPQNESVAVKEDFLKELKLLESKLKKMNPAELKFACEKLQKTIIKHRV